MALTFSAVTRLRPLLLIVASLLFAYSVVTRVYLHAFPPHPHSHPLNSPPNSPSFLVSPSDPDTLPASNDPYGSDSAPADPPPALPPPPELAALHLSRQLSCPAAIEQYGFIRGLSAFQPDHLTKSLVIPRMPADDVAWVQKLPPWLGLEVYTYNASPGPATFPAPPDSHAVLEVPRNKGNEAMTYLTYIIDHYAALPDVSVFVHAHASAWHNNDLHLDATPLMLRELNYRRVVARGFMNLRCHWVPGCPDWIMPFTDGDSKWKFEETLMAGAFRELFPRAREVPKVLAGACCAQFAVSREALQSVTLGEYMRMRQWLLDTEIEDRYSGRILEYLWHYIFTGKTVLCPQEHVCYCDGYGMCFGGQDEYDAYMVLKHETAQKEESLKIAVKIGPQAGDDLAARERGIAEMREEVKAARGVLAEMVRAARERGRDPEARRREVGEDEFSGS
ncbi:hypothetical protein EDC01DRAFT_509299 [Geopyxis carbonaria]|nr:hypothetical protein EDC01DRAFT_509299 [Geopyxis carbonaria]